MSSFIRRSQVVRIVTGSLLGGWFASASYSQTIPNAIFNSNADVYAAFSVPGWTDLTGSISVPGSISEGPACINGGGCGSSDASTSMLLTLSISGNSTASTYEMPESVAGADILLYYEVLGPGNAYTAVPMIFTGNYSTSAAGSQAYAQASVQLSSTLGAISNSSCATSYASSCGSTHPLAPFVDNFSVYSSSVAQHSYDLNDIALSLTGQTFYAGNFSAQIDPALEINPTWLLANPGYSLVFSPNFNPTPVPLPASVWLLLGAMGGVAGLRRIRQHQIL